MTPAIFVFFVSLALWGGYILYKAKLHPLGLLACLFTYVAHTTVRTLYFWAAAWVLSLMFEKHFSGFSFWESFVIANLLWLYLDDMTTIVETTKWYFPSEESEIKNWEEKKKDEYPYDDG